MDSLVNFGRAILSVNYNASATSIVLSPTDFAKLPQTAPYNLVWWNHTDFPSPEDDSAVEIVRVTALNAGTYTLTITRAQEGTAAVVHNLSGKEYWLMNGLTKAVMDGIQSAIDGKAPTAHTHTESNVANLTTDLAAATAGQVAQDLNIIDLAINLEVLKGATLTGVSANIFVETFLALTDITLSHGTYDAGNRKVYL